ncbi:uncharacterized protein C4orf19 homolog [Microtus oregoni]|uniref:uncharacterized protein C4orf19 homolog n=1 Tax=Microtus oregoni TaxID=111838 RepID=UPI001BB2BA68|nr:uncharacterized protein C4orf19 homolog [Microtus oregoni]XP_041527479.1 uncharacterized protein C4orf19 homolog [Microtus oregoni]XP_041527480.1 uncharacterized protein C4orf19 homolog [Microtus oregoni]XP_041527481.1 uncharacterized protein C4orf19 homolog [Microtus oregoni]XP_041527482.1 uncharacterized protein C4orf19 homolog [Microtus oregoni]XP_041527483.1 uncharacterized protein C4orf19 homolog [Microtus oregoni]XP_041527484.1 uncharacterized protein C4orf19 homolog [Microtus oregon
MGCRCCKMIHSYLFDPVQVPSPGFVNEVSSCKLEEDTVRLKGTQNSEFEVPRNALHAGSLSKPENRDNISGLPHQGPLPQEDSEERRCAEKQGIVNGISPTASLHLVRPHQDDGGSWASSPWAGSIDSAHPAQPFLEGEDCRKQSHTVPTSEETQTVGHGDCRAPAEVLAVADHILHIPAPDYPQLWSPTVDGGDPEEKDYLFENHSEVEPLPAIHPSMSEQGLNLPFSLKRSWDSLNEAGPTEVLNVCFKEEGPAHPPSVVDSRSEREVPHTYNGDRDRVMVDEDAEVAEALAALEAATAGEDADEAD